jgi:hypothetical protein
MNSLGDTKKALQYLFPLILIISIVSVYPFVQGMMSSLYGGSIFAGKERFVGIDNFVYTF